MKKLLYVVLGLLIITGLVVAFYLTGANEHILTNRNQYKQDTAEQFEGTSQQTDRDNLETEMLSKLDAEPSDNSDPAIVNSMEHTRTAESGEETIASSPSSESLPSNNVDAGNVASSDWMDLYDEYSDGIDPNDLADLFIIATKLDLELLEDLASNGFTKEEQDIIKEHMQQNLTTEEYDRIKELFELYSYILDGL